MAAPEAAAAAAAAAPEAAAAAAAAAAAPEAAAAAAAPAQGNYDGPRILQQNGGRISNLKNIPLLRSEKLY